jgi:SAM-dependent methyltransferase
MKEMWDKRYSEDEFAYGERPNDFLAENVGSLPPGGKVLCLADGEGRNSFFLAQKGFQVTGVDFSEVGMAKAQAKSQAAGLEIDYVVADLDQYSLGESKWDAIVSIFAHFPVPLRHKVHGHIATALKPGGVFLLEAYRPEQFEYKTGGPPDLSMMMESKLLQNEIPGLKVEYSRDVVRDIHEGKYHHGKSAVVQFIARKS